LADWTTFFINSDLTNCPITCVLKDQGCTAAYSLGDVNIGSSLPYDIIADKNVPLGYQHTLCKSCSTNLQTITFDNYIVTQLMNCAIAMINQSPLPTSPQIL